MPIIPPTPYVHLVNFINQWDGEKYDSHSSQQKMVAEMLIQQYPFKSSDSILDIGCGSGEISASLAKCVSFVVGIDPSPSMINFANEKYAKRENIRFQLGKASELSYNHEYDVITAFSCLHWEPQQEEALLCFKKALKPGGAILLAIPGPDPMLRVALKEICTSPKWYPLFKDFQSPGRIWTANEYAKLLLDTGFIIRKIEVVMRPYAFREEEEYKGFVEAMLPHLSSVPKHQQEEFLREIIDFIRKENYVNESGDIKFNVQVLEVIAYSPLDAEVNNNAS